MIDAATRARIIEEAKSWLGTPYHHMGRVKGAGVDCAMLLAEVYAAAGVIDHVESDFYPLDWHMHRDEELYLSKIFESKVAFETTQNNLLPGDVVLARFGWTFSHGAIVIEWPLCIHASIKTPVSYVDVLREAMFKKMNGELRPMKFFTL